MYGALSTLRHRAAAAIVLPILAAVAAACNDSAPLATPPPVDTAELEQAAERVETAADRVDRGVEQLEAAPISDVSEFDAILSKTEALRLLALISQIEIELDIVDALIDRRPDSRPGRWPLEPETAAALGFASSRLSDIYFQLADFVRVLIEPPPAFEDESILTPLTELQAELELIRDSISALWQAHEADEPSIAPATRPTTVARTRISRLIEALSAFLAREP